MTIRKYINLDNLSTFLSGLRTTFAALVHTHTMSDITDFAVDDTLSPTSTNPVQNKVISEALPTAITIAKIDEICNQAIYSTSEVEF